jgi:hypothetical protein
MPQGAADWPPPLADRIEIRAVDVDGGSECSEPILRAPRFQPSQKVSIRFNSLPPSSFKGWLSHPPSDSPSTSHVSEPDRCGRDGPSSATRVVVPMFHPPDLQLVARMGLEPLESLHALLERDA